MNKKGYSKLSVVLLAIIFIAVLVVGYVLWVERAASPTDNTNVGLKEYKDTAVSFQYPPVLSVAQNADVVSVSHSVAYKHSNVCDFKGDAPTLDRLTDFNVSIKVINKDLKGALLDQNASYIVSDFYQNNTLKLSEGFIDRYSAGSLNGFQITSGAEGCGAYSYYFPASPTKTIVVNRSFITEFNPIIVNYQTYLNLPGIVTPTQEKDYFADIVASLKVK